MNRKKRGMRGERGERGGSRGERKFAPRRSFHKDENEDGAEFSERPRRSSHRDDEFQSERPRRSSHRDDEFQSERPRRSSHRDDEFQSERPRRSSHRDDEFQTERPRREHRHEREERGHSSHAHGAPDRFSEKPRRSSAEKRKPQPGVTVTPPVRLNPDGTPKLNRRQRRLLQFGPPRTNPEAPSAE